MQKISKKAIGLILVIILCISMMPMSAMATGNDAMPDAADLPTEQTGVEPTPTLDPDPEPSPEPAFGEAGITEIPIKVTVGVFSNGHSNITEHNLMVDSNANSISIPLSGVDRIVVNQGGMDLYPDQYSLTDGILTINAPVTGGDIIVSAYPIRNSGGITVMSGGTTVNHERQHYNSVNYGYVTSYYVANGNVAYCLDPSVSGVNTGTYDISGYMERGTGRDNIIKAAWYLYHCPGEDSSLFAGLDWEHAYGYSHVAASYIYMEIAGDNLSKAWEGIESNTAAQSRIMSIVNAIKAKPMPPSGFNVFLYNVGNQTSQSLMGWEYAPTGNLEIQKVSSNTSMTDNNDCYSLEGAVFGVYNSGGKIGTITTDKDGKGRLEGIDAGQTGLYILEEKPPKGYAESDAKIPFEIASGQTTIVEIKNNPQGDPATILLQKLDAELLTEEEAQGSASLKDAHFEIKYYKGHYSSVGDLKGVTPARKWVVKTDEDGFAMLGSISLVSGAPFYYDSTGKRVTIPLGTITVQEIKAPTGYMLNDEIHIRQVKSTGKLEGVTSYNAPTVKEQVIRGGVSLEKWDFELNRRAVPQGDATLAGAVFAIYNRNENDVIVNGKTYAPGAVVHTMTTDATGTATTPSDLLPFGDYEIIETTAPTGYLNTGVIRQTFSIKDNGVIVNLKTSAATIKNNVARGGVELEKWDIERDERTLKQGDATLAGAVLDIWNRSKSIVVVGGKEYEPDTVVHTMTTDANGWAGTTNNLLPYGSYEIIERTPPTGYLNTGVIKQAFEIRTNGEVVSLKASDKVIKNNIIRGGVRVQKWDNEIDKHQAQGGATLEGAIFEIVNRSIDSVLVLDKLYAPGEVVYTFSTDENGVATTSSDLLPYGTYEVREIKVPNYGYLPTGVLSRTFTIREHGKIVDMDTSETAIKNDPIRGDLKGVKISDGDAKRLAGVPFSITSVTTGESHIVVTDRNGEFNTHSSWNPHSQNTNRGETDEDGIWFGELWTLDDDNGALLYDTYLIEELPCEANADKELLSFEVSIYRHMTTVDLGTLTNDYIVTPEIFTIAMDKETMLNDAFASEKTEIIDTVYYSGLKVGKEYTLTGTLMDKETGNPLLDADGKEITATKTFRALGESGSVAMTFTVDTLALRGKSVVVFETLEFEGKEIAVHADIDDEGQTIAFKDPEIGTTATDTDGEKELDIDTEATIVDTVSFSGLIIDQTYTIKGILMDKETGEPLMVDGKQITAEKSFIAKMEAGTFEVEFTFNSVALKGKSIVVFESLEYKGREIAVHADIEDDGQTVTFKEPKIGTSATGIDGEKELDVHTKVTIVDVVSYENLVVGKTYTVKGILMDKTTGKPLMVDGKEVTAEAAFEAQEASGAVEVVFTFDAMALKGKSVVVFENLYLDGTEIAVHADIEDEDQTVTFSDPKIGTTATGENGEKELLTAETVTIVDVVAYENLTPGKTYVISGILMDKSTGEALLVDGKEVTAETSFVPKKSAGSVEVEFTFNALAIGGKEVVVFENLYFNDVEIAVHADINDEAQTVRFRDRQLAIELTKTNSATNEVLDGAEFVLRDANGTDVKLSKDADGAYQPDANGSTVIQTTNGKAVIKNLKDMSYTLTETKAPDGFDGFFEPVKIQMDEKNTLDNPFLVTIFNVPTGSKTGTGAQTGGNGLPVWLLFVAFGAIAGAVAIMVLKKKKQRILDDK